MIKNNFCFTILDISICGLCNRRCIFCPKYDREKFPNLNEFMEIDLYKKIMLELKKMNYNGRIAFSGFCEPLLHKDLTKLIKITKDICPDVSLFINTNGDILNVNKLKDYFDSGLNRVNVSLYENGAEEKFIEIKTKVGLSDEQFQLRLRYMGREKNYGFIYASNRAGAVSPEGGLAVINEPIKRACYYPFYILMIDYNGDVMICPNDWKKELVLGNLRNDTLKELWDSKRMERVRIKLMNEDRNFSPCSKCNVDGKLQGQNSFDRWVQSYKSKGN